MMWFNSSASARHPRAHPAHDRPPAIPSGMQSPVRGRGNAGEIVPRGRAATGPGNAVSSSPVPGPEGRAVPVRMAGRMQPPPPAFTGARPGRQPGPQTVSERDVPGSTGGQEARESIDTSPHEPGLIRSRTTGSRLASFRSSEKSRYPPAGRCRIRQRRVDAGM